MTAALAIALFLWASSATAVAVGKSFGVRDLNADLAIVRELSAQRLLADRAELEKVRRAVSFISCIAVNDYGHVCQLPVDHRGEHQAYSGRMLAAEWPGEAA